jgi:hypothetical protein
MENIALLIIGILLVIHIVLVAYLCKGTKDEAEMSRKEKFVLKPKPD